MSCVPSPIYRMGRGVCSAYLADLQVGDVVRGVVKPSAFRATDHEAPVVLIGPGTGIAPFRAVLRERAAALKGNGASNAPWGPSRVSRHPLLWL